MLPDSIRPWNVVDWIPVDDIAGLVVDIGGITEQKVMSDISGYFHGINPHRTRTVKHSVTMKNLGPITEELVRNWCKQWKY
ncbi:hypothetical protein J3458_005686 [Metarhizium acridum]|uniref:uncharacterized protein n=1 Tax=Metarhizium acridum TaxID=92637 RepID=UPI001C6B872A|nr:hypothetical protein J3458_005686 [Metarhizium acridum]